MNFSFLHPRDQIVETMERIYSRNMTTTSGGNISIRDENGDKWMTPARVDKGSLRRQDVVRIGRNGACEGLHPPSSENPFHLSVYDARPDIRAIIHAHPGALVSFSICGQVPNTRLFPESWNICGQVAFAPYEIPGSTQLGARIAAAFASESKPSCVVLENHGVVVGGSDLAEAFQRFETLEFTAQTIINARQLGEVHYLSNKQIELSNDSRNLMPEGEALSMTSREKELRKEISDFVHRAYDHRLMTSTWGSFSARIEGTSFVITPSHVDRQAMSPSDLAAVHNGRHSPGQTPSRAARLHAAIYNAYPEIQAVVNALPVWATAFCVSDFGLNTRTIPESYLFLKDVGTIPFEHQFGDDQEVTKTLSPANPVVLLRHNGVLVAGRTILDAFDRLEVLEATAAAIIQSRPLGPISPMSEKVTRDLLAAFPGL
jgi:L-fuculose-phosphate aldolase